MKKHKAHLVAKAYSQEEGIDCNETFAPMYYMDFVCHVLNQKSEHVVIIVLFMDDLILTRILPWKLKT